MFSVIIPTLQRSATLGALVEQCAAHPLVAEVLVVNNAPESPLAWASPKVRVLTPEANVYVNPAWNWGVRESSAPWIALVNDDICFDDEVFDHAAAVLREGFFGMIGPDASCLNADAAGLTVSHRFASRDTLGFGTFMCLRRENYTPVPDDLLIWAGDHWLFWSQPRPNAIFVRTSFRTEMGTTAGSPEFQHLRAEEAARWASHWKRLRGSRWWHRPMFALEKARMARHTTRQALRSLRPGA